VARGEINTDGTQSAPTMVQSAQEVGQQTVDPRVLAQRGGSSKRSLEEGMVSHPKRMKSTRKLSSQLTPQAGPGRRQGVSSQHRLGTAEAQADQARLRHGRVHLRGRGHGHGATQRTQHIQYGRLELSSSLAQQSGQWRSAQPTVVSASPDALRAQTDAEVAQSWQRRMSGYFDPPADV
jgi:hypothetical protein